MRRAQRDLLLVREQGHLAGAAQPRLRAFFQLDGGFQLFGRRLGVVGGSRRDRKGRPYQRRACRGVSHDADPAGLDIFDQFRNRFRIAQVLIAAERFSQIVVCQKSLLPAPIPQTRQRLIHLCGHRALPSCIHHLFHTYTYYTLTALSFRNALFRPCALFEADIIQPLIYIHYDLCLLRCLAIAKDDMSIGACRALSPSSLQENFWLDRTLALNKPSSVNEHTETR